ncbi:MAG: hypothetical protein N4A45_09900 [Flavobacteriales bacterium]|jgi:hypothetical protein|nr:hypothetical protein [Flavobacteriales bacterium]
MHIHEVDAPALEKAFYELPKKIYHKDKNWIQPLDNEVKNTFTEKNKAYKAEWCKRYVLFDDNNQPLGRIAAFLNQKTYKAEKIKVGGIGFFECIDNQEAANVLFDTAIDFLKKLGVQAVDGPINLGERDKFWGCVVENFTAIPSYNQGYNLPYYQKLIENYGFQNYFEQFVFHRSLDVPAQEIFVRKYNLAMRSGKLEVKTAEGMSIKEIASYFVTIYNSAWGGSFKNFKAMKPEVALKLIKSMKPIMDKKIIVFVFNEGKPIAFYINIPELNEIFRHVGSKLNLIGKLKFMYYKMTKKPKIMIGLIFGVVKEFQGQGIEGVMVKWFSDHVKHRVSYEETTLNWIGDFNPKMLKIVERLDTNVHRKLITYRYMIDENIPFERHPVVG